MSAHKRLYVCLFKVAFNPLQIVHSAERPTPDTHEHLIEAIGQFRTLRGANYYITWILRRGGKRVSVRRAERLAKQAETLDYAFGTIYRNHLRAKEGVK